MCYSASESAACRAAKESSLSAQPLAPSTAAGEIEDDMPLTQNTLRKIMWDQVNNVGHIR